MATYSAKLNSISRIKINIVKLIMDSCDLTFGVSPCTATGIECYNTFPTCGDQPNYDKVTKEYEFIDADLPLSIINNFYGKHPLIKMLQVIPSEIKDGETIVRRLKIQFYDDKNANDFGIDPYVENRASVQGSFWKKFIARNKNYKGRIIELREGFNDVAENDFELKFAGRIDNISIDKGVVTLEAVDLLRALKDIKYPLSKGIYLDEIFGDVLPADGQTEMLALRAQKYDYCERQDFVAPAIFSLIGADLGGSLVPATVYYYILIAYDARGNPIGKATGNYEVEVGENAIQISWTNVGNASYYRLFGRDFQNETQYWETAGNGYDDDGTAGTFGIPPGAAKRYYILSGTDPTNISDWNSINQIEVDVSDDSELPSSGYLMIGKEVVSYSSKSSNILLGMQRALFGTSPERHNEGDEVKILLNYTPDNAFTILDDLLTVVGKIPSAYIGDNFATYEAAGSDINVSARPIIKANNLADIYFDLVNIMDCLSWVGEDGKIEIIKHSENPPSYNYLSDEKNFILNSVTVNLNEESRFTRWGLYWNTIDPSKGIKESEAYSRFNLLVDADAESDAEYNDVVENIQHTVWLNDDSDVVADIVTFIDTLLAKRQTRTRDAQEIIEAEVELKDSNVMLGDIVKVTTNELQDKDGNNFSEVEFRVMRKEPIRNKIQLKLQRRFS